MLDSLTIHRQINGSVHPDVLKDVGNLAVFYVEIEHEEEAVEMLLPHRHPQMLGIMLHVAIGKWNPGHYDESALLAERCALLSEHSFGAEHPRTIKAQQNTADTWRAEAEQ